MRKIVGCVVLLMCLSSCVTVKQFSIVNIIDYSKFVEQGFYVTEANSVDFEYVPVGSIVSISQAEIESFKSPKIDMDRVFQEMIEKLKKKNANGVINLNIQGLEASSVSMKVVVTGMAIRTKKPVINISDYKKEEKISPVSECIVDDVKCLIMSRRPSGTVVVTDQVLTGHQVKKAVEKLELKNKSSQFFVSNGGSEAYAGTTDNGYYINYATKEFIKLSDL